MYVKYNDLNSRDSLNSLNTFLQSIRGLRSKSDEFTNSFLLDGIIPLTLCLSEHHMEKQDLPVLTVAGYSLLLAEPT
jgi:hypothetical protein